MLGQLSESGRIGFGITIILLGLLGACGAAYVMISDAREQSSRTAERDVPLAAAVGRISIDQLNQAMAFDRSLRLGETLASDPAVAEDFAAARQAFEAYGRQLSDDLARGRELVVTARADAASASRREAYDRLLSQFDDIRERHALYEGEAKTALDSLEQGRLSRAQSLLLDIERRETEIGELVDATLGLVETAIGAAFAGTAGKQRNALAIIGLLVATTGTFFVIAGFLTVGAVRSERRQRNVRDRDLFRSASYDALTNLPNREHFVSLADLALRNAHRSKTMLAVMAVDLDDFKQVNDALGHELGDQLLQEVADGLTRCVRETDTVGRLEADEFVVSVTDARSKEDAAVVARKMIKYLSVPLYLQEQEVKIGASIGIAVYPSDATDVESLLARADAAVRETKRAGKNAYRFCEEPAVTG